MCLIEAWGKSLQIAPYPEGNFGTPTSKPLPSVRAS